MQKETSIALGFFDGVHKAHKNIILSAVKKAGKENLEPIVLTFDKSPAEMLSPENVCYIITPEEKKRICESLGAGISFLETEKELLDKEPEDFVREYLVEKYKARHISCGYNYRFGKSGKGDPELLEKLSGKYGFTVEVSPCITKNGEEVSSSRIRTLIKNGYIKEANELLERSFSITGTVTPGKQLGTKMGFPTANVLIKEKMLSPKRGVYKTRTFVDEAEYSSVTNVGINPTVAKESLRAETYIGGYSGELYGKEIRIEFDAFIREERKFEDIEALKAQISEDIRHVLR